MSLSREIVVSSYPEGRLSEEHFELVEREIRPPSEGEVLIKNLWLSIEAGQRTHLSSIPDEIDDAEIHAAIPMPRRGEPLPGQAIGQVIESQNPSLPVGTFVVGWLTWSEYLTSDGSGLLPIDAGVVALQSYLGTMGLWGAFAYFGLLAVAKIEPGETVVVSAAAGSVGSVAVQVAKLHGCRVVGIVGSDEKVDWLVRDLGADAAINYKTATDLASAVAQACPEGIDVFFDTVAGRVLEIAIDAMKPHGRIVAGGTTSAYDSGEPAGPRNYFWITPKRLSILGCSVIDFLDQLGEYREQMSEWLADGRIVNRETIYEGIETAPRAWIELFEGKNLGKMLVRIAEPS